MVKNIELTINHVQEKKQNALNNPGPALDPFSALTNIADGMVSRTNPSSHDDFLFGIERQLHHESVAPLRHLDHGLLDKTPLREGLHQDASHRVPQGTVSQSAHPLSLEDELSLLLSGDPLSGVKSAPQQHSPDLYQFFENNDPEPQVQTASVKTHTPLAFAPIIDPVEFKSQNTNIDAFDIPDFDLTLDSDEPKFRVYETAQHYSPTGGTSSASLYEAMRSSSAEQQAPLEEQINREFQAAFKRELAAASEREDYRRFAQSSTVSAPVAVPELDNDALADDVFFKKEFDPFSTLPYNAHVKTLSEQSGFRIFLGVALILIGLAGVYFLYTRPMFNSAQDEPILIKADTVPFKIKPENAGGKTVANQNLAVYEAKETNGALPKEAQLVSEFEEPLDIASVVTKDDAGLSEPTNGLNNTTVSQKDSKSQERIVPEVNPDNVSQQPNDLIEVTPKKVRTITVKADGTLVENGIEAAIQTPINVASKESKKMISEESSIKKEAEQLLKADKKQSTSAKPVKDVDVTALDPIASKPANGDYFIQIASTPSQEAAKSTYAALTRKYGDVLTGYGMNVQKADIAGKGTVYRIRIPAGSKDEAANLCVSYKSLGGNCFVTK
jgi:hypothetical protein